MTATFGDMAEAVQQQQQQQQRQQQQQQQQQQEQVSVAFEAFSYLGPGLLKLWSNICCLWLGSHVLAPNPMSSSIPSVVGLTAAAQAGRKAFLASPAAAAASSPAATATAASLSGRPTNVPRSSPHAQQALWDAAAKHSIIICKLISKAMTDEVLHPVPSGSPGSQQRRAAADEPSLQLLLRDNDLLRVLLVDLACMTHAFHTQQHQPQQQQKKKKEQRGQSEPNGLGGHGGDGFTVPPSMHEQRSGQQETSGATAGGELRGSSSSTSSSAQMPPPFHAKLLEEFGLAGAGVEEEIATRYQDVSIGGMVDVLFAVLMILDKRRGEALLGGAQSFGFGATHNPEQVRGDLDMSC